MLATTRNIKFCCELSATPLRSSEPAVRRVPHDFADLRINIEEMMTLPRRDEAVEYILAHGLRDLLSRAASACVKADTTDPVEFLTENLQAIKEEEAFECVSVGA